jgi:two-component system response regulator YesN
MKTLRHVINFDYFGCFIILVNVQKEYPVSTFKLANGLLLNKPVNSDELDKMLEIQVKKIRWGNTGANIVCEALNYYFSYRFVEAINLGASLDTTNRSFGFMFREGNFRVLIAKLDCDCDPRQVYSQIYLPQKRIADLIYSALIKHCYEIVSWRDLGGVIFIINYNPADAKIIEEVLAGIMPQAQTIARAYYNMSLTIGVGTAYREISGYSVSLFDANSALWTRRISQGTGRIIYWKGSPDLPLPFRQKFDTLRKCMLNAIETLDIQAFTQYTDEIFSMPRSILENREVGEFFRKFRQDFFRINSVIISSFSNSEVLMNKLSYILTMTPTLEIYKQNFVNEYTLIMNSIIEHNHMRLSKQIRLAISYIKEHYTKNIKLEEVASAVNISKGYLSTIFKKETGDSFTEFINAYRIQIALNILKDRSKGIAEVANNVGFNDAKYFTKQFKKFVGVSPMDYRR